MDGNTALGGGKLAVVAGQDVATLNVVFKSVGTHNLSAVYNGDSYFLQSPAGTLTETLGKGVPSAVLGSSANPAPYGQLLTFTMTLGPAAAGLPVPTGTVTITNQFGAGTSTLGPVVYSQSGGNYLATVSLKSGMSVGVHTITATYSGDGNYQSSVQQLSQTVTKAAALALTSSLNPSVVGNPVTFTLTFGPTTGVAPTGSVTLSDTLGGTTQTLGPMVISQSGSNWIATLTTNALAVGSHTLTAHYAGDADYAAGSPTLTQTVNKHTATALLASSANPAPYGQLLTFTLTLGPAGTGLPVPTGTVTFTNQFGSGTSTLGPVVYSQSGGNYVASVSLKSGMAVGTHTITATYSGDGNYQSSVQTLAQSVTKAAALALTTSLNPSIVGGAVTFTLTFGPTTGVAPTGAVTLSDTLGGTTQSLGPMVIGQSASNWVATLTTSALAAGSHTLTAHYAGDAQYAAGTAALSQTVNAPVVAAVMAASQSSEPHAPLAAPARRPATMRRRPIPRPSARSTRS